MSNKQVKDFFASLSLDPKELEAFLASPDDYVRRSDLSGRLKKALIDKDIVTVTENMGPLRDLSNCEFGGFGAGLHEVFQHSDLSSPYLEEVNEPAKKGSLSVVGTGIRIAGQLTPETAAKIKAAERVLYVVNDSVAEAAITALNPGNSESLADCYVEGEPRAQAYARMIDRVLEPVRAGKAVCMVTYGHPGVFALPTHIAIRKARHEGFEATMYPAVSAADCLYADLGVDPATGSVSYEATDFLRRRLVIDPTTSIILWQIGVVGQTIYRKQATLPPPALSLLVDKLTTKHKFPADHKCVVYEAAPLPGFEPLKAQVTLQDLPSSSRVTANSTLYVPPAKKTRYDREMEKKLGEITPQGAGKPNKPTK